jgi:site-specific recombinase
MAAASRDLQGLLAGLDPTADVAQRHIWLIDLFDWLRGDRASPQAAIGRVSLLLDAVEARPELRERLRAWWRVFTQTVDLTTLLADYGFAPRTAFLSELSERLRRKILPGTPETTDASDLFRMVLPGVFDAGWIALLDEAQLARIGALLADATVDADGAPRWRHTVMDAVTYCSSQVVAAGFSPELRLRISAEHHETRPFHALMADLDELREQMFEQPAGEESEEALQAAFVAFRDRLDACRASASSVYTHLEDNGISVGLVFRLRQLRERVLRIRELLDCLMSPLPAPSVARLIGKLVLAGGERNSIRALIASNSSMLAAKVTERSAETGEHYITRDRASYLQMVKKAAGGGALTAVTVLLKFGIYALALSAFWAGLASGLMYAASFVAIQLLHLTLATKQPAMTAPALAARLRDIKADAACGRFHRRGGQPRALAGGRGAGQRTGGGADDGRARVPGAVRARAAAARRGACRGHAAFALTRSGRPRFSRQSPASCCFRPASSPDGQKTPLSCIAWTPPCVTTHASAPFWVPPGLAAGPPSCAHTSQASPPTSRWDSCSGSCPRSRVSSGSGWMCAT